MPNVNEPLTIPLASREDTGVRRTPTQRIDLELFTLIERYATNLARWDLLIYFGEHPNAREYAATIAQHVGRKPQMVEQELDDLVYLGILTARHNGRGTRYALVRAPATRRAVIRLARDFSANA